MPDKLISFRISYCILIIGIVLMLLVLVLDAMEANEDVKVRNEWEKFKIEHNCKNLDEKEGTYRTDGKASPVSTGNKDTTSWLCNDGVAYHTWEE